MHDRARKIWALAGACLSIGGALGAAAQQSQTDTQRFEWQLEQIQRDTLFRVDQNIPPEQRATFDYGAYLTFSYFSIDDNVNTNHGLRQVQFLPYARLNLDGVHEFYGSVRGSYRDFNPGDPFEESEGSGWRGELGMLCASIAGTFFSWILRRSICF